LYIVWGGVGDIFCVGGNPQIRQDKGQADRKIKIKK
jgi:hypothetical protein